MLRRSGLLGVCQAYGFRDMGVFFDWASLFQKDPKLWTPAELVPEEERTEDQRRAVELYRATREPRYLALAQRLIEIRDLVPGTPFATFLKGGLAPCFFLPSGSSKR